MSGPVEQEHDAAEGGEYEEAREKRLSVWVSAGPETAWKTTFSGFEFRLALSAMYDSLFGADACGGPLELALVSEPEMAALNLRHMGCCGPTNILSFPSPDWAEGPGELAMCPDVLALECLLYRQELPAYTLRMLAHGMAHLAGYGHGAEMDAASEAAGRAAATALAAYDGGGDGF